jgi:hypothetical protein
LIFFLTEKETIENEDLNIYLTRSRIGIENEKIMSQIITRTTLTSSI